MSPAQELLDVLHSYVDGARSLEDLHAWLLDRVELMGRDQAFGDLADRAWVLISEYDRGDRDEDSVRAELRHLLPVLA